MSNIEKKTTTNSFPSVKDYDRVEIDLKNLTGKILTVIDGAIIEERQNKAVKDQIKSVVRDLLYRYQDKFGGDTRQSVNI